MPAESKSQRRATAIALHHPDKLYDRNKGLTNMKDEQLEDYASTSEKNLPFKKSDNKPSLPMGRGGVGKKGSRKGRRMGGRSGFRGGSRY